MNARVRRLAGSLVLVLAVAACGTSGGEAGGKQSLDYATLLNPGDLQCVRDAERWADKVKDLTDGDVEITIHPSNSLVPADEILTALDNGVTEAGCVNSAIFPTEFPMWVELASVHDLERSLKMTPLDQTRVVRKLMEEFPQMTEELEEQGLKLMYMSAIGPHYFMLNKKVTSLDDFKGLRIRTNGPGIAALVKALGAQSVEISSSELYTATQSGLVDGAFSTPDVLKNSSYDEIAPHIVDLGTHGSQSITGFGLNSVVSQSTWDGLSKSQQDAMLEAGQEVETWMAEEYPQVTAQAIKDMQDRNDKVTISRLSEADLRIVRSRLPDLYAETAKRLDKRGLPGSEFVKRAQEIADEILASAKGS